MEQLGSHWTDFYDIWCFTIFFRKSVQKIKFRVNLTRTTGTVPEGRYIFLIMSGWILVRMRNTSDKSFRENQNTHFVFSNSFPKNRDFYEKMWKNILRPERTQMKIWRMRIACWITRSDCVIISVFLLPSGGTRAPLCYVVGTVRV
jgi:hypothetical protein